jgi:iron complex outermembrane receptor protein
MNTEHDFQRNGSKNLRRRGVALLISCGLSVPPLIAPTLSSAQEAPAARRLDEIVVTARKREESILKVPVVVTAVPQAKLEQLQVSDMADLPRLVPGLNLGQALLSIGTLVSIRGVGTTSSDPGIDQSISLNIDGLSLGQGLAFSSGMFDLGQIEVLKGPQALFYGKSSPGGVISLRTADPTDRTEVITRAGYEFEGREARGELIFSGPVTETVKARLAAMYSEADGYFKNRAEPTPGTGAQAPTHSRETQPKSFFLRNTVLWNPNEKFSGRFKFNYVRDRAIDAEASQLTNCPEGPGETVGPNNIPFIGGDDCKLDRDLGVVYMDPAAFPGIPNGGVPYLRNLQRFGTAELNFSITPELTVTSLTGYYDLGSKSLVNTHHSTSAGPSLAVLNRFSREDITQELRLNSDFSGPLNFTVGALYQDGKLWDRVIFLGNTAIGRPPLQSDAETTIDIETYSAFAQLRWRVLENLELAGGARWTDEKRKETVYDFLTGSLRSPLRPKLHTDNIAPEFTATFTPRDDLTLFASYKRGYKSGSFTVATPVQNGADNSFDDEKVRGFEGGMKASLLDGTMLLNLAGYDYKYRGLQVGATQPVENGQPIIRTINAGSARTYGVDFDVAWRPANVSGLGLNASVNWNHARYKELDNIPCWGGQTIALGCDQILNPVNGRFTAQDLSGTPLARAPKWQTTFGFDYELPMGPNYNVVIANSNTYSSKFVAFLGINRPDDDNYQSSFFKSDVSVALRSVDDQWEVALIGKNITDKITSSNRAVSNYAGGLIFGGQLQGTTTSGPAGLAEGSAYTERGRSVWVRLTYRPLSGR